MVLRRDTTDQKMKIVISDHLPPSNRTLTQDDLLKTAVEVAVAIYEKFWSGFANLIEGVYLSFDQKPLFRIKLRVPSVGIVTYEAHFDVYLQWIWLGPEVSVRDEGWVQYPTHKYGVRTIDRQFEKHPQIVVCILSGLIEQLREIRAEPWTQRTKDRLDQLINHLVRACDIRIVREVSVELSAYNPTPAITGG